MDFSTVAQWASNEAGQARSFVIAIALIVVWGLTGPIFHYSDTWQLIVNTATTIVTFLMVFLLQHTQTRDTLAIQVKLDALITAAERASNRFVGIEERSQAELEAAREEIRDTGVDQ